MFNTYQTAIYKQSILICVSIFFFLNLPFQTFALKEKPIRYTLPSSKVTNVKSTETINDDSLTPKLTIILNLFDGTRQLIDNNEPVHIEIKYRLGEQETIEARDAQGPIHKFEGLTWHGNAYFDLLVQIQSGKYDFAGKFLDDPIDSETHTQKVNVMMIPKRQEIRAFNWQQISDCCSEMKRIFSADTTYTALDKLSA